MTNINYSLTIIITLSILILNASSYIPAIPTNETIDNQPTNDTNWFIQLNWHPIGIFSDGVTRQLKADHLSQSLHQGVLLHFSELNATNQSPVDVPWIAMISCDSNTSSYSMIDDIFTLARDHGAAAAMLYSLTSKTCNVNNEYLTNFEKPLDVFSSGNLQGARLIESQFSNVVGSGYWYQSDLLNSSSSSILKEINQTGYSLPNTPTPSPTTSSDSTSTSTPEPNTESTPSLFGGDGTNVTRKRKRETSPFKLSVTNPNSRATPSSNSSNSPIYLIATLANSNAISNAQQASANSGTNNGTNNNNNSNNNANTGLAMIILYAITGCVTLMFLIVIISGAIRAVRHPERYGPRPGIRNTETVGGEEGVGEEIGRQTRAAGLTRAILDTFPVVKFGRSSSKDTTAETKIKEQEEDFMMQNCITTHPNISTTGDSSVLIGMAKLDQTDPIRIKSDLPTLSVESQEVNDQSKLLTAVDTPSSSIKETCNELASSSVATNTIINETVELVPTTPIQEEEEGTSEEVAEMVADVNNSVTCPICVCDFDADDDIRVLPCDARHRFHQECVDPWLLNVSRFCPLCRWDLSTRKDGTKIESNSSTTDENSTSTIRNSNDSDQDRPTEAQVVANLRIMLENSRPQQNESSKSKFKKYINLVRKLRNRNTPEPSPSTS
ncbi:hypothetical protein CROQUDRAFT_718293 [Cronartium quercuum f. sp. fusiforme G11]|uniref:RING-type domain-containing protein n=1 Tax=Cronartium quercuum f. sp. fusiforme G11 TaxID=708437 RepID=A0A9P6N7B3_9BASI|nr:hypothetical protein CROQUDRAFT_718293 [Cronartium quercuum f. sp. fusiforme G11]